jgi:hypothetical protein
MEAALRVRATWSRTFSSGVSSSPKMRPSLAVEREPLAIETHEHDVTSRHVSTGLIACFGSAVASRPSTVRAAISSSRRSDFPRRNPSMTIGLFYVEDVQLTDWSSPSPIWLAGPATSVADGVRVIRIDLEVGVLLLSATLETGTRTFASG